MKKQKISKNKMATLLKISRTQVDRLLNPKSDITLSTLQRAAAMKSGWRTGASSPDPLTRSVYQALGKV